MTEFKRITGYAGGRLGYGFDHIVPLGSADTPASMQWQTFQSAKEKDRWATYG